MLMTIAMAKKAAFAQLRVVSLHVLISLSQWFHLMVISTIPAATRPKAESQSQNR
jgi:hypothetical protein